MPRGGTEDQEVASQVKAWSVLLVIYLVFVYWYTSFQGPLDEAEIEAYLAELRAAGGSEERLALWRGFMESDTGDDFVMLNAIDLRERPPALVLGCLGFGFQWRRARRR